MRYFFYFIFLALICGISVGLAFKIPVYGQSPNLLLLVVFVYSLDKTEDDFLLFAFLAGIFLDVFSGSLIGSFTFPFLLTSFVTRQIAENFLWLDRGRKTLPILLLPFMAIFYGFYFSVNFALKSSAVGIFGANYLPFARDLLIAYFYNLILLFPVYWATAYLKYFLRKYVEKEYKAS